MTSRLCRDKGVVVAVYAEKPKGQGGSRLHLHHHHHHYHHINQNGRGRGYNRRAELLDYSRHLRKPVPPDASPHPPSQQKQLPTTEALAGDVTRKQKHSTTPNCFHKWGFVVTRFVKSMRSLKTNKDSKGKRNHKKSLKVQRKGNLLRKLLAALQRRRWHGTR